MKLLVLFVFHKYNSRVKNFIERCIYEDENVDFIVISNNKDNVFEVPDNVKTLFRDNIGYDFGGWSDALLTDDLYESYDKFIFVNSSVFGPFFHQPFNGRWTDFYINGLQSNIKLFGSTICADKNPKSEAHVQSYIFSMDKITLQYLIDCEIFSLTNYAKTYEDAIREKEILMSRKIIQNNWNIGSLLSYYNGVDFTFTTKQPEDYDIKFLGDIMWCNYINRIWTPEEVVFIKGNRIGIVGM